MIVVNAFEFGADWNLITRNKTEKFAASRKKVAVCLILMQITSESMNRLNLLASSRSFGLPYKRV
jgi:hypothetical protein